MSGSYDPEWIYRLETVTPADIHKAIADATAAGEDGPALNEALKNAIRLNGGIEEFARKWTFRNRLAALRVQMLRKRDRRVGRNGPT